MPRAVVEQRQREEAARWNGARAALAEFLGDHEFDIYSVELDRVAFAMGAEAWTALLEHSDDGTCVWGLLEGWPVDG